MFSKEMFFLKNIKFLSLSYGRLISLALFEQKGCLNIIGVMSGTSLDGLDLAYVSFRFEGQWQYELHCTETIAYSEEWVNKLSKLGGARCCDS